MVDGGFFFYRYRATYGANHSPEVVAKNLFTMCISHLSEKNDLYRIFFYDCPPLSKKAHNPISKKAVDFSKTGLFQFRNSFHQQLLRQRKVALRFGRLADHPAGWSIKPSVTKDLLSGKKSLEDLVDTDVTYEARQKGVDMKMGLDIASLAFKGFVKRIVMVAGDADFVPAAKFARREGIDVVLDPMWQGVGDDLFEHIDGLTSKCPKPNRGGGR